MRARHGAAPSYRLTYYDEPVEVPAGTLEMYANGAPQGEQNEPTFFKN
jgi:hypothetical protein